MEVNVSTGWLVAAELESCCWPGQATSCRLAGQGGSGGLDKPITSSRRLAGSGVDTCGYSKTSIWLMIHFSTTFSIVVLTMDGENHSVGEGGLQ